MLKHIVSWKMNGATPAERDRQADEVVAALLPLDRAVPSVVSLSVHKNQLHADVNWDVILVSEFVDAHGLAEYDAHPDHQAAKRIIAERAESRAGVDFFENDDD